MPKLNKSTKAMVDHAIRAYRSFDVMHYIEAGRLPLAQLKAAEAYLAQLKAAHAAKFGGAQ